MRTNNWLAKITDGFTHVAMAEVLNDEFLVIVEPTYHGGNIMFRSTPHKHEWNNCAVLELEIKQRNDKPLRRPLIQNCTTLVQYLCGFYLNCYLPGSLYQMLTTGDWLELSNHGIKRVKLWEHQQ